MNRYLCTEVASRWPSTVQAQCGGGWFRFDKGRMLGRRSSTIGSRRTTSSGLDEIESISIQKLLGVSSERKSPTFISSFIFIVESTKRETSLIVTVAIRWLLVAALGWAIRQPRLSPKVAPFLRAASWAIRSNMVEQQGQLSDPTNPKTPCDNFSSHLKAFEEAGDN
ncbi:hypothetical protein V6N13_048607 [Hibiscus sabdariffa]|uniref:Uncharacterized protein n=1 Tax=Hibiscus sabdariffa TaxID=183260 RepID=A0ABR2F7P0_9ROSI